MKNKILLAIIALCSAFSLQAAPVEIDRISAIVDDSIIMKSELDARINTVKRQMAGQLPPDDILKEQVLERLILESIQLQMADRGGVQVSDQQLTDTVKRIAKQNGMTIEQFSQALKKDGLSYREAVEQIRTEMLISRVQKFQVNNRVKISEQDVDYFLASKAGKMASEEEYRISHILISIPSQASPEAIKKAAKKANDVIAHIRLGQDFGQQAIANSNGRNALKGGDLGWRKEAQLPSLFAEAATQLNIGEVSEPIKSASGFHIIQITDKRGGSTFLITQTKVRHILVMPNEIRNDADAESRINQVYKKLTNDGDFAELAKEYSDDPGSAANGGDLGWVNPGDMVPAFDTTMNDSEPGKLSKPFKSQFGWHILEVEGRQETDMGQQVQRNQVHQMLQARQFEEELPIWLRKIRSESYVDIKGF
ncbi:molecular chaperone SurA [Oleispira antarctica]|uniref:Chaperone SurA n=1 Tax=Oleispira antarctica TaxID=188908 RepID=A0A1Y5HVG7_OLEAN|nr:molecular chaperone SurA [Oleispira antarctica]